MLWEAGPGVCLCISLRPIKRRRRARLSGWPSKCTDRPHLPAAACSTPKASVSNWDWLLERVCFFHTVFQMINILSGHGVKNQSSPVGPGACLCVRRWESVHRLAHVCKTLYTLQLVCWPKCIYLCALVCVCHSSGRQF